MTIGEVVRELTQATAYIAAAGTGLVGLGFVRLTFGDRGLVHHLALGLMVMHAAVFLRTLYWDVARDWMPPAAWEAWTDMTDGISVNLVFNVLLIFALYHSLKALKLSIPEDIRGDYTIVTAALYPRLRVMQALTGALRRIWRRLIRRG